MTTPLEPVGFQEECPQCKYPHMASGHQRCISCGWSRGSEISPPVGNQFSGLRESALASLLPGTPGVSIEQRIQASASRLAQPPASEPPPPPPPLPLPPPPPQPKQPDPWPEKKKPLVN